MLTELRAKHNPKEKEESGLMWGINGNTCQIERMDEANIWDPMAVKV